MLPSGRVTGRSVLSNCDDFLYQLMYVMRGDEETISSLLVLPCVL